MQKRLGLDLEVPNEFGYWLAGFTDGEGYFHGVICNLRQRRHHLDLAFKITLREDDRLALEEIRNMLGVGYIKRYDLRPPSKPTTIYIVHRVADLYHVIVPLFEKYPLRTKKARDFQTWKDLVEIQHLAARSRGAKSHPKSYWDKVEPLVAALKEGRKFNPPPKSLEELS